MHKLTKSQISVTISEFQKVNSDIGLNSELTNWIYDNFLQKSEINYKHHIIIDIENYLKTPNIQKSTIDREIIEIRYLAMFILTKKTKFSKTYIGILFDVNAPTVIYGIKKIEFLITQKYCNPLYIFLLEKYNIKFKKYKSK